MAEIQDLSVLNKIFNGISSIDQFILKKKLCKYLEIPQIAAENFVEELVKKKILVKDTDKLWLNPLFNQTRNDIYTFIEENPGCHFNFIKSTLGIGSNQLSWHLSILEEKKYIKSSHYGKYIAFSLKNVPQMYVDLGFMCQKLIIKQILSLFIEDPLGLTLNMIEKSLNIPISTIRYWIDDLISKNLIENKLRENQSIFSISSHIVRNDELKKVIHYPIY
jgi:predicted transcriptional regulator